MAEIQRVVDWMPDKDLRQAAAHGLTLYEIAELNYRKTGYQPTRSAVHEKLKELGALRQPNRKPFGLVVDHVDI